MARYDTKRGGLEGPGRCGADRQALEQQHSALRTALSRPRPSATLLPHLPHLAVQRIVYLQHAAVARSRLAAVQQRHPRRACTHTDAACRRGVCPGRFPINDPTGERGVAAGGHWMQPLVAHSFLPGECAGSDSAGSGGASCGIGIAAGTVQASDQVVGGGVAAEGIKGGADNLRGRGGGTVGVSSMVMA